MGLLSSMPDLTTSNDTDLIAIPGTPPDLLHPPKGDAFARRSRYALILILKKSHHGSGFHQHTLSNLGY